MFVLGWNEPTTRTGEAREIVGNFSLHLGEPMPRDPVGHLRREVARIIDRIAGASEQPPKGDGPGLVDIVVVHPLFSVESHR